MNPTQIRLNEVHVLEFPLDRPILNAVQLLDPIERERANRFVFDWDRHYFVAAHASVRLALGGYIGCAPESLRFRPGLLGKPELAESPIDLRFNLSHAGDRGLLAIALQQDVGIDVERERPIDVFEIAERFFSPPEVDALRCVPPADRVSAFFRCWTRKEAFVKAFGAGLSFPFDAFEVSIGEDASDQLLRACSTIPDATLRWSVRSVPTTPPYQAAVAAGSGPWRLVYWPSR